MSSYSWFSKALSPWYGENKRPLPWRGTTDPYRIWLSEVILQQTRVDQGTAYWHRFVEHYPTVRDLAAAPEDEVLRLWQGLGYYSRARNLRTAAQQVVQLHKGQFPADHGALLRLRGVGDYTASAIGSIAFGLPEPVVDGNVYRVLARVFGIDTPIDSTAGRKQFRELAAALIDRKVPGDHNQAVMELGATVCTPKKPLCGDCPLARKCIARATDRIVDLPVKSAKTKVRVRHFNYLHIATKDGLYLQQRTGKDIWQGLFELPLIETEKSLTRKAFEKRLKQELGEGWSISGSHVPVKHVLSHQVLHTVYWKAEAPKGARLPKEWQRTSRMDVTKRALPRPIERYLGEIL